MTLKQKCLVAKVLLAAGLILGVGGSIMERGLLERIGLAGVVIGFALFLLWHSLREIPWKKSGRILQKLRQKY